MSGWFEGNAIAVYNGDPVERSETVASAAEMTERF